jgi:multiple sugar transport system permease protein
MWGYLFLTPWILGLLFFAAGPIAASLFFSFTDYNILGTPRFVGIQNYSYALRAEDDLFWSSLGRTFYYAVVSVPLGVLGSLLLAVLLNQALRGTALFRTLFFLPHLTPTVAAAILWVWIFHPQIGPANAFLARLGLPRLGWLTDRNTAIPSLIIVSLWAGIGSNRMMIFLAGLQGVPQELHDAAHIDGAGLWQRFRHVTLPMISPTMLFNLILGVIGALNVFSMAFVATGGGPNWGTWFYALHVYRNSFQYFKMGYASTLAWILAAILMALTYIQLKLSDRWVYYAGQ